MIISFPLIDTEGRLALVYVLPSGAAKLIYFGGEPEDRFAQSADDLGLDEDQCLMVRERVAAAQGRTQPGLHFERDGTLIRRLAKKLAQFGFKRHGSAHA